ncbi:ATP-binding protein [Bradyrhizobium roseum]|uniref:ATP-binding protein n=1 Tax=Bradyrhizobium roseum TaxID=3056648 RepID=UPI002615EFF4|nr:ATP-binding protein [Bradyrhizobium roseus]WKA29845.1 ATP-binding protein [Bradyrhizobium roseus]
MMAHELPGQAGVAAARSSKDAIVPYLPMIVAAFLMVLSVVAAGTAIWNLHDRVEKETRAGLDRVALVIAEQTSRSFQSVDLVLKGVIDRVASASAGEALTGQDLTGKGLHEYMAGEVVNLPQVANLILINAEGDYSNSSQAWPVPAMSLAHREQFKYLRDNAGGGLFVSQPVRNKLDGAWTLYLARRLSDKNGVFLGVAQAAVRLKHFEDFYASVSLGEGGSIALLRNDGMMLVRYPLIESMVGEIVGRRWRETADPGALERKEVWAEGVDGKMQYVALNAVPEFPLAVSAALTKEEVLGSWRRDAILVTVGAIGAAAGITLLLMVLVRKMRRMRHSEMLLERQNRELERSSRLLLDAQRVGKLGHWSSNESGKYAIWSPQLFDIAGIPPISPVPFDTLLSLIHPEDLQGYLVERSEARSTGKPYMHEHRWVRPDGSIRWVRIESDPQSAFDKERSGTFGIVLDLTERKQAEAVAEESQARLVDAIESLAQGFILYDREDRFVLANSHFREMFPELARVLTPGMQYDEVLRAALRLDLFGKLDADAEEWLARTKAWHYAGSKAVERMNDMGRWIQFVDHKTSDGGTVGLRTDITEFKQVQTALEQKLGDLERIRADLEMQKRELLETSEDLVKAKDAAEAASRAKSDFLAMMSHEIRTPLSGMVGMIELLRETPLSLEQERFTALAKESSDGLLNVVNDILDFSKLEAGRISPEFIEFDIVHVVKGVASLMTSKARDKGLELSIAVADGLPHWLKGDGNRIRQVLLNLVNNAIKFTDAGRIGIEVSHQSLADDQVELRIEVTDTGIGIGPETQLQLFNPFVQADTSVSRKYGGSGLGLAICKQLCGLMGGAIGVDSHSGKGSRFWFTARCGIGSPRIADAPSLVPDLDRSIKVLVAEDSPIIATLISSLLKKQNFEVQMVTNGLQAVAAVTKDTYDIVLMDINMPEMDGISATRAIRALPGRQSSLPIVALTANAIVGQREIYLAAGMNDYVTKPIQPHTLFQAIQRWVAPAGAGTAAASSADEASESTQLQG